MSTPTTSTEEPKPQEQEQQQPQNSSTENGKQKSPGTSQQPSGQQTPRSSKNKTPPAAVGNTNKTPSVTSGKTDEKEETEEEKQARLKKEEEEELLLRPWMSPAKPSILKHHHDEAKKQKKAENDEEKEKKTEQEEGSEQQKTASDGEKEKEKKREAPPASASATEGQGHEEHHIAFKDQPEVFPDHIYSQQARLLKKLKEQKENEEQSPSRQIQEDLMEVDDVCERLYAEAIAKRRLAEEASKQRQRELEDEEAGFDEECTFHPDISEAAKNSAQFENWEQFLHYREEKNKTAALRWRQKKAKIEKEKRSKELGEELKMAPLSEKLLAYKKKQGQPHRGPIKDYDKYLGKFILKKTEQDKGLAALESGDNSVREIPDPVAQKELTNRLYEDAIARVAARQVIERARHAADRAKLFQPMTNERLIAKLKELNPDADNDSWLDDANVETRLLSQGESYRLRNERRKNQHELESMKDCTFTPRTNPKSRQMLQNWARRAELGGGGDDPSSVLMRVDRNLDQDGDYAPLQGNGGKVYASEAEALAVVNNSNSNDGVATSLQSNQGSEGRSSRGSVGRPRHIPDPDGYFEKVKMRQAERERQLAEKRRQQELAKEDGCTFRPAMAPLTVALAKIRDDKEFGAASSTSQSRNRAATAAERDREILMPPHLRPKTAEWGEAKGSPRKYPRGVIMQQQQQQQNVYYQQQHPSTARQHQYQQQQQQQDPSYHHSNPSTNRSSRLTPRTAKSTGASSASRFHSDPYANNNNNNNNNTSTTSQRMQQQQQQQQEPSSSEHFLEDLEHELQGVISNWQSTDGM